MPSAPKSATKDGKQSGTRSKLEPGGESMKRPPHVCIVEGCKQPAKHAFLVEGEAWAWYCEKHVERARCFLRGNHDLIRRVE